MYKDMSINQVSSGLYATWLHVYLYHSKLAHVQDCASLTPGQMDTWASIVLLGLPPQHPARHFLLVTYIA